MQIESNKLIDSLRSMKDGKNDIVGRSFDRGIECAISLVKIYEDVECKLIAQEKGE